MKTTATNIKLRKLLTGIKNGTLIPRPEFQRRLVWSSKHKNAFVRTVIEGFPFPEIYIAAGEVDEETGEGKEILVDGQQRITTLFQYFTGILKLEKNIPTYQELETKSDFLEYDVVVRDLGNMSIHEIKQIFLRINSTNYALNPMEINNARFDGAIKQFADKVAENEFFEKNKVFTSTDIKRMGDTRFTLSIIITLISNYFNRDKELESYLDHYNDEFPHEQVLEKQLQKVFNVIDNLDFDLKHRVWKKADLFTLIVELHKITFKEEMSLNLEKVKVRLHQFYKKVDEFNPEYPSNETEVIKYVEASRSGTNDRTFRIERGKIIRELIIGKQQIPPLPQG